MTQEEKARELAIKSTRDIDDKGNEVYNVFVEAALQEMAAWKEQQMIDNAVEWMRSRQKGFINKIATITEKDIQDFKKAMEE